MKINIAPDPRAPAPIRDMKLLRGQLAQMIGEDKRLAYKLEDIEVSNTEMVLTIGQMALSMDQTALNLISRQRDETPAKVELLEKALREVTKGKIEKTLQYYDIPHTQPDHHRARDQQAKWVETKQPHRAPTRLREYRRQPQGNPYNDAPSAEVRTRMINNIKIDIPFIPKAEVTDHRVDTCRCLDCGRETVLETGLIKGTSLGIQDCCRPLEDKRQLPGDGGSLRPVRHR